MTLSEIQKALVEWSEAKKQAKDWNRSTLKRLSQAEAHLHRLANQLTEGAG